MKPLKPLINAVLFQIVWFVCLLAGNVWAVVITALYLVLHDRFFMRRRREWRLLLAFLGLGILVDGTLFQLGIFASTEDFLSAYKLPPIWLLCLWISVGTLFVHSLAFLQSRYWLSAVLGAIGPTMSYFAGASLAGITLAQPTVLTLGIIAIIWALVIPFGVWMSERWGLFQSSEVAK
ncbi:DUF2878 domain-containing protein [Marinomonas sp. IMCC 4694]|uniref:DUF2878 domain-containing protein n=1 Tax=Marinomonas sp. IMCC 4694 TaxID=2605432 RepID=UPI0011E79CBE|nr:DUF2878 domain-containing protein [Marinomonas sp. IMCC 4694]TYL46706.1 DUF2878 domain-containing protein [Marinomonas sp. IMCC 4694]